jgi:hypothetical protein
VAHSKPFLAGTILFSSISPNYARNLLDELWGCFKYMKIPFEELKKMPTKDRKYFIQKHNIEVEEENEEYERRRNGGSTSTESIDRFTDMSQGSRK